MTNPDDLKKALAKNGAYDGAKAENLKAKTVGYFKTTMRKAERSLWQRTCLFALLGVFAATHFIHSSGTKTLLFYGLLTMAFLNILLQTKTWFSIAHNKISVLKAVTQLELRGAGGADVKTPVDDDESPSPFVTGLPRWEQYLWWLAIVGGAFLILFAKGLEVQGVAEPWDLDHGSSLTSEGYVKIEADGSGTDVTELSSLTDGILRQTTFNYHASEGIVVRFNDSRGKELPARTTSENGRTRYQVRLLRQAMAGRRVSYSRTQECPKSASEENGVWTHSGDISYGYNTNEFSQTVVLPEGAEIVSVEPWPVAKFTLQNRTSLQFEGTRGCNDPFRYTVRYRLADGADGASD